MNYLVELIDRKFLVHCFYVSCPVATGSEMVFEPTPLYKQLRCCLGQDVRRHTLGNLRSPLDVQIYRSVRLLILDELRECLDELGE